MFSYLEQKLIENEKPTSPNLVSTSLLKFDITFKVVLQRLIGVFPLIVSFIFPLGIRQIKVLSTNEESYLV